MPATTPRKLISLLLILAIATLALPAVPVRPAEAASQYITDIVVTAPTTRSVVVSFHYGKDTSDEYSQGLIISLKTVDGSYKTNYSFPLEYNTDPRGEYRYIFRGLASSTQYLVQIHAWSSDAGFFTNYYSDWVSVTTPAAANPTVDLLRGIYTASSAWLKGEIIDTGTGYLYDPDQSTIDQPGLAGELKGNCLVIMRADDDPPGNLMDDNPDAVVVYGPEPWDNYHNAFDKYVEYPGLEPDTEYVAQVHLSNVHNRVGYSPKVYFKTFALPTVVIDEIVPKSYEAFIFATITVDERDAVDSLGAFADDPDAEQPRWDPARISAALVNYDDTTGQAVFRLSGLTPETGYDVQAFCRSGAIGDKWSNRNTFTTLPEPARPTIVTQAATSVRNAKAKMNASITDMNYSFILEQGFLYSNTETSPIKGEPGVVQVTVPITAQTAPVSIGALADNLTPDTTYYFQSYVRSNEGTAYGGVMTFTTLADPEVVTLADTSGKTTSGIDLYGEVIASGGISPTLRGFVYSETTNPMVGATGSMTAFNSVTDASTGQFSAHLAGLSAGTTYYYKAFIHSLQGTTYGVQRTFTTDALATILPAVTTNPILVVTITDHSVDLSGSFTAPAGTTVSETGFVFSRFPNPVMGDLSTGFIPLSDTDGFFATTLGLLDADTVYYVRAYAENENGYGYGANVSFTTLPTIGLVSPAIIDSLTINDVTATSISVTMTVSGPVAAGKYLLYSATNPSPVSGGPEVDQVSFSLLDGSNKTVTGLLPDTTYYLRGYTKVLDPIRGSGYAEYYSDTQAVTTDASGLPIVSNGTPPFSDVTEESASISCQVNPNGSAVTKVAIVWSATVTQPTIGAKGVQTIEAVVDIQTLSQQSFDLSGLRSETTYHYAVYALNGNGFSSAAVESFTTSAAQMPEVSISGIDTSPSGAVVTLSLAAEGTAEWKTGFVGVLIGETENPTLAVGTYLFSRGVPSTGTGQYTFEYTGLQASTQYYARPYTGTIDDGNYFGDDLAFTTQAPPLAVVELYGPENITGATADFTVDVLDSGGSPISERGVVYNTSGAPSLTDSKVVCEAAGTATGAAPAQLSGLAEGTRYYARAYATTANGTAYSDEVSFLPRALISAATAVSGNISEINKSGITLGDALYLGNAEGLPIRWRVVSGSAAAGTMTLLAQSKVGDTTEFDRDPDGREGPLTPSNNYRDSDMRSWLNGHMASSFSGSEQVSIIKMRVYDATTGVSMPNGIADETDGDYAFLPLESQMTAWSYQFPGINQYWSSYWVRDPDLSPYEGYAIPAGGGGGMRVFVTSLYAPRPVVVLDVTDIASVWPIVDDNTGKPWAIQADGTNYSSAVTGKAYALGISTPVDLYIDGVPTTPQTTSGTLVLNGIEPSLNNDTASLVYLIHKKSDGSILRYQSIAADDLSSVTIDAAGLPAGGDYAVRMWLQRNATGYSPSISPFYSFDLQVGGAPAMYTITFNANGGEGVMAPQTFTGDAPQQLTANTFTRDGCAFEGWATSASGPVAYSDAQSVTVSSDATLYAVWAPTGSTQYTITFDANGGICATASALTDASGRLVSLPTPSRSGYSFDGWYTSAAGGVNVNTSTIFTAPTTVYAHWTYLGGSGGGGSTSVTFTISATAGEGGSIFPSGTVSVSQGETKSFAITPAAGYSIADVVVDGSSVGGVSAYTFTNVQANHTIAIAFGTTSEGQPDGEPPVAVDSPFDDVLASDWFYAAAKYVKDNGIMTGTSASTFSPGVTTSRAMLVTMLHRMENLPAAGGVAFTDVPADQWFSASVAWSSQHGIVSGYGDGRFGPNDPITREQMAAILFRYAGHKGHAVSQTGSLGEFADAQQVSGWAQQAMQWAVGAGLITGKGNQTLDPQGYATRAEVATILMRYTQLYMP